MPDSPLTTRHETTGKGVFANLNFTCTHCGKELKAVEKLFFGGVSMTVPCWGSCGCEESKWDGLDVRHEDRRYARAGIPLKYLDAERDLEGMQFLVSAGQSLYIHGEYGSGKTYYASVLAKSLLNMGHLVFFTSMPNLIKDYQKSYDGERTDTFDRAYGCDILVLDDFGKEKVTADTLYIEYLLIDGRYSASKPTVFTSNFSRGGLATRLAQVDAETAQAIISRMSENTETMLIDGPDRRLQ